MGVGEERRDTARERRALIIRTLEEHLGRPESETLRRFRERLLQPHLVIAGSDIDGILSAMMLGSIAEWRVAALVLPNGSILASPTFANVSELVARPDVFGVDVFSPLFPSVSNHPVLFGSPARARPIGLNKALGDFDAWIIETSERLGSLNLSIWARIGARLDYRSPHGFPYKYPLGTAQFSLALLELAGRPPRFYDRDYLPWLVADCDGGLDSIRQYHWNVELWWSTLAAVVGPGSLSDAVYQLAMNQRATQFVDVDLRLRRDYGTGASSLNPDWNLASVDALTIGAVVRLIRDISGWPDPYIGGADALADWRTINPTRNVLPVDGLTKQESAIVDTHLSSARKAVHVNFSRFPEKGTYLGWMLPTHDASVERTLGGPPAVDFLGEQRPPRHPNELLPED